MFQTAFLGDLILTLPLLQVLKARIPAVRTTTVTIPLAAGAILHHPDVDDRIVYDKKGSERGLRCALRLARRLREERFDVALIPHRSIRSALLCRLARIPRRIGFSTSAGRFLLTDVVQYERDSHEIMRNLSLLKPLGIRTETRELPRLYPDAADREVVEKFFVSHAGLDSGKLIAVAPGSVWNTKRWPEEKFAGLVRDLTAGGYSVVLVGGSEDSALCGCLEAGLAGSSVASAAGLMSVLQSAELIRRSRVLVSNDSAPVHIAVAVGTPVVALFGATIPGFGFAPAGPSDIVMETTGLTCRPCSIHGGEKCPIGTFDCMNRINVRDVQERAVSLATDKSHGR